MLHGGDKIDLLGGRLVDSFHGLGREHLARIQPVAQRGGSPFFQPSSSASANTKGSWAEITSGLPYDIYGFDVVIFNNQANRQCLTDIGFGAGGAEVVVVANLVYQMCVSGGNYQSFWVPIFVPRGTRVSARTQCSTGSSSIRMSCYWGSRNPFSFVTRVCDTYGADTSVSSGTVVDPGGSAGTPGAWTQFTASSTRRYEWMGLTSTGSNNASPAATYNIIEMGVGAGGSEVSIFSGLAFTSSSGRGLLPCAHVFPCDIPLGSRISLRSTSGTADATDRLLNHCIHGFGR